MVAQCTCCHRTTTTPTRLLLCCLSSLGGPPPYKQQSSSLVGLKMATLADPRLLAGEDLLLASRALRFSLFR